MCGSNTKTFGEIRQNWTKRGSTFINSGYFSLERWASTRFNVIELSESSKNELLPINKALFSYGMLRKSR